MGTDVTIPALAKHGNPASAPSMSVRRWKRRLMGCLVIVTLSGLTLLWVGSKGLLPFGANVVAVTKFAATKEFASLPRERQEPYVKALIDNRWKLIIAYKSGQLTRAELDAATRNCWSIAAGQYVDAYFAMERPADQRAYLDQLIDEFERYKLLKWAAGAGLRPDSSQSPKATRGDGASPWMTPSRTRKLIETMPPVQRARVSEFYTDLLHRRAERGLSKQTEPG